MHNCPICGADTTPITGASAELKIVEGTMRYFRCGSCEAVHVPQEFHLTPEEERERYALHDNSGSNEGYRKYLKSVADSVRELLPDMDELSIIDYGAGEEAVLTEILTEEGVDCRAYDPNYEHLAKLDGTCDLLIACECVEHFRDPMREFRRMDELLNSGGFCYIRTEMLESTPYFSGWWYKNDLTHIVFYSRKTMSYIGEQLNWELTQCDRKNSILFTKR